MIDVAGITKAIKDLLDANLANYSIHRNAERNEDASQAAYIAGQQNGWINVMRGAVDYNPHTTGATPWLVDIKPKVEVQVASMTSAADAEDRLQDAEKAVLDVLTANKTLSGTVLMTNGYGIAYEYNPGEQVWHHSATITIHAQARA